VDRPSSKVRAVRFELLAMGVALAVVVRKRDDVVIVRVARRLPNGRVMRMRKECRTGFSSTTDLIAYFDALHARYGSPCE
jgi:hypothetical protein